MGHRGVYYAGPQNFIIKILGFELGLVYEAECINVFFLYSFLKHNFKWRVYLFNLLLLSQMLEKRECFAPKTGLNPTIHICWFSLDML